jgi:L-lactate dehydrogenase complex protein LldG
MSARENILKRLRDAQTPFTNVPPIEERQFMQPVSDTDTQALRERFITMAKKIGIVVHEATNDKSAIDYIIEIVTPDKEIIAWDYKHIPLSGLQEATQAQSIQVVSPRADHVRVGITGVEAGLAATGSIIVSAKEGKPRSVSLLPLIHVAVIKTAQIIPHFEAWIAEQKQHPETFREVGNHIVITGASRTADIAMELVMGAHGPKTLHFVLLD